MLHQLRRDLEGVAYSPTYTGPVGYNMSCKEMERKFFTALACLASLFLGGAFLAPARNYPASDLPSMYFAGRLVLSGKISRLYSRAVYEPLIAEVRRQDPSAANRSLYYNRPAWEAPMFVPLAFFTFHDASLIIVAFNLALLGLVVWLLPSWFPSPWLTRPWLAAYLPFLYAIAYGQDTILLALVVGYGLYSAVQGRDLSAGIILAFASYKPHTIFLLPIAMISVRRWRMLGSFVTVAGGLMLLSFALVGFQGFRDWLDNLSSSNTDSSPLSMPNLRAIGLHLGMPAMIGATIVTLLACGVILYRRSFIESAAAALLMSLLVSPHTYPQDYSLVAVAALATFPVPLRYVVLLPWVFFWPGSNDNSFSAFICMNLFCLLGLAATPSIARRIQSSRTWKFRLPAAHESAAKAGGSPS